MRVRYKSNKVEAWSERFNVSAMSEILTGDDSCFIKDMEVFINGEWKDMSQAFKNKDIIPDNYNEFFGEPKNEEDKKRGYFL